MYLTTEQTTEATIYVEAARLRMREATEALTRRGLRVPAEAQLVLHDLNAAMRLLRPDAKEPTT